MAQSVGELYVEIGADTSKLDKSVKNSKGSMQSFGRAAKKAAGVATAAAAGIAAATSAIVTLSVSSAQASKEIQNLATIAGDSVEDFQKLAFAAKSVGVQQDELADIFKDTQDKVGDFLATGGGALKDFFEKIAPQVGLTAEEFRNLSGAEALGKFQKALDDSNLSMSEQVFFLESIASNSTKLRPLLTSGAQGFEQLGNRAEALGLVLSDIDLQVMSNFNKDVSETKSIFSALSKEIGLKFIPILQMSDDGVLSFVEQNGGVQELVDGAWQNLVDVVGLFGDAIQVIRAVVAEFVDFSREKIESLTQTFKDVVEFVGLAEEVSQAGAAISESFEAAEESVTEFVENSIDGLEELSEAAAASLGEERASEALVENLEKAETAARAAALAQVEYNQALTGLSGGGATGLDATNEAKQKQLEAELESLRASLMTQEELENNFYEGRLDSLNQFLEAKLLTEQEFNELRAEEEQRHSDALLSIEQERINQQMQAEQNLASVRMQTFKQGVGLLGMFAGKSKAAAVAQIALNKGLAIAQTIQNTAAAQVRALAELGPVAGAAAAAQIGAFGAAQVGVIAATGLIQAGGAISGGGGISASGDTASSSIGAEQIQQQSSVQAEPQRTINIRLEGSNFGADQVVGLVDAINQELSNGALLNIS